MTRVERHYDTFRLYFEEEYVDLSQAVALQFYFLTISFGILRAGTRITKDRRKLLVAMDRFPGRDTDNTEPGKPIPPTPGSKFIEFVRTKSKSGAGMVEQNKSIGLVSNLGSLDWWKSKDCDEWKTGKSHPHFVLPDWLAAAAIAHEFRNDFVMTFPNERIGNEAADALEELHATYKTFDLWSLDPSVLPQLRASEKHWRIPDDARAFIQSRAERSTSIPPKEPFD